MLVRLAVLPFSPQLLPEDLRDQRVLDAMERIPRKLFVPEASQEEAERDIALAIGYGQTISQPYIVAYMTAALGVGPGSRVLEIGTGSGYQTAVLAAIGAEVYSIELIPELSKRAQAALTTLELMARVHLKVGDGRFGWAIEAPFDAVVCTAAPTSMPIALVEQVRVGGRLVLPLGARPDQELKVLERQEGSLVEVKRLGVRFVPLVKPEVLA
jgi:protein-L-isoaspartate(D-aspartate) O-methyltransferase